MIFTRYLALQIFKGTAMVLLILISISLFFVLIQNVENVGEGQFGSSQFIRYLGLRIPAMVVDFLPLATLIGTMLSLGSLASGSELIAFQAAGVSIKKYIISVSLSAFILALCGFLVSEFVVPQSETTAKHLKSLSKASRASKQSRTGVWIKDGDNIIFVRILFPDGNARLVDIFRLDDAGRLKENIRAGKALMKKRGWVLRAVTRTVFDGDRTRVHRMPRMVYKGNLTDQLIQSLVVDPSQMSSYDLHHYIGFLSENGLNHAPESLSFWQKIYKPLTVVVMAVLALPFVLGLQRDSNTGHRIITGIVLGLVYVIVNRLLIQLGEQLQLTASLNALLPTGLFILLTIILIQKKLLQN